MKYKIAALIVGFVFAGASYADGETMELKIVKAEDRTGMPYDICTVTSALTNKTSTTFQAFSPKVAIYDGAGNLIMDYIFLFKNIRPGKTVTFRGHVEHASCGEIDKIVIENIHYCQKGGGYLSGCEHYITAVDGVLPLED